MTAAGYQPRHSRPTLRPAGPAPAVPAASTSCPALGIVTDNIPYGRGLLTCDLDPGHPGAHLDRTDRIAWILVGGGSGADDPR